MNLSKAILMTSNPNKRAEFERFQLGYRIGSGPDLDEVKSDDPLTVILYKALASGEGTIVEDTSLHVEGAQVGTEIRWLVAEIPNLKGRKATWETNVAYNDGDAIHIAQGICYGVLTLPDPVPANGFAFDPYFVPEGAEKTLHELSLVGEKDPFSARYLALWNLANGKLLHSAAIAQIEPWRGEYQ